MIEGSFDGTGQFSGSIRIFGKERGNFAWAPTRKLPNGTSDKVGPFRFCLGTFEQAALNTSHTQEQYAVLSKRAEEASGIAVYRDDLRVMPYGRPDSDFFNLEERRGLHAGREFWAHRRCFGRVAFTRQANPNLRDKAGREGLIDNRARREMRLLVVDFLKVTARRFFGSDSDIRKGELPIIQARNAAARDAADKAAKRRRRNFRSALKSASELIVPALDDARSLLNDMRDPNWRGDVVAATVLSDRLQNLSQRRVEFDIPPRPAKLGEDEAEYRRFRDGFREFGATIEAAREILDQASDLMADADPSEITRRRFNSNQSKLSDRIGKYSREIDQRLAELKRVWSSQAGDDSALYNRTASPLLSDVAKGTRVMTVLNALDVQQAQIDEQLGSRYEPFLRTLDQLIEGIDLDSALGVTEDERTRLSQQVEKIQALAQLGITVEIVGHELETLDEQVERNLRRLPSEVQKTEAFRLAYEAHRTLTDQLRFLAPMNLAGYRARRRISGEEIADFVQTFFKRRMDASRASFVVTEAFRKFTVSDLPSRIFPVFINLVNNALYWITFSNERTIKLDRVEDKVIVADSGPGVDPDDVESLFELFFSRRAQGRGVGLHLCRINLAVAHHTIRYRTAEDPEVLPGANFVIEFKGIKHD